MEVAAGQAAHRHDVTANPAVSIVIPCRNEAGHIEACLRGVLAFEEPRGGFEVVVADGMSSDGTREIVARAAGGDPRVRLIDNPARTTPHALNAGIGAAHGHYIARIDAHTEYAPDYLVQCLAVSRETSADNVGGPALTRAQGLLHRAIAAAYHSPVAVGGGAFHNPNHEGPADTVPYGFWRKERLLELGLFDEELVRNQDDELNLRIVRSGGVVWQSPRIRSWYTPRASLTGLFRQYFQYGYWKVRVIQKHRLPASPRHLVPAACVAALAALVAVAPFSQAAQHALIVVLALYMLCIGAASAALAARAGWRLFPLLPAVFATYHLSYGAGFLAGIWDFVVLRRQGRHVGLSR
ncbi:MAG TPA: glycosyltransferase family 2 protein [Chthonomonadales bacterium]|nr:glycosyltransferase family 2 protein [Chthonomonadales bacterium]